MRRLRLSSRAASGSGGLSVLYRDAAALASSSMLTALVGVVFWIVVARKVPPSRLGVQTALLSALTAPAIVIASGVGDAFTALLPSTIGLKSVVVRRGYRIVVGLAAVAGIASGVIAVAVLRAVRGSAGIATLVAIGTLLWALFTVQDSALTAMGRARWLPIENGSVSVAKLASVPALVAAAVGMPVIVATLAPAVVAVAVLAPRVFALASSADSAVRDRTATESPRVETKHAVVCRQLDSLTWRTTLSVALTLGALTFLPFAVTVIAGPVQGAAFALCLAITQSLDFVGSSLGVSLVVQASARADQAAQMARQVWRRAALIVGAGAVVLTVAAPVLMRAMNPAYLRLHSTEVIAVMCASSLTRTVFVTWSALQRARRALRPVLSLNFLGALTLYSILPSLAHHYGALGAAVALATAQTVLSTGAVAHILFARRRQRFVARTGALHRPTVPLLAPAVEGRD